MTWLPASRFRPNCASLLANHWDGRNRCSENLYTAGPFLRHTVDDHVHRHFGKIEIGERYARSGDKGLLLALVCQCQTHIHRGTNPLFDDLERGGDQRDRISGLREGDTGAG